MYQNTKSATTAGLLGIFLGAFGAHNWYLGEKGKGIAHVCMMSGGILLEVIVAMILPNVLSFSMLLQLGWVISVLAPVALLAMSASGIWGLVEGIIILSQGDAGLARKGYAVAEPMPMQNYNQPMNNYGQPMSYNQPMNNGYGMPMNNGMGMNNMNGMNNMGNSMGANNNMNGMNNGMNGNINGANSNMNDNDMNNNNQNNMSGNNNGQ